MIRQIIKLIWNRKGNNSLLLLEIFLSFLVLFAVLSYVIYNMDRLNKPIGFETENRWMINLANSYGRDTSEIEIEHENLRRELLEMPEVKNVAFSNFVSPFGNSTYSTCNDDIGYEICFRYGRVGEDFGNTLDVKLLAGRWFEEGDDKSTYRPMIVNKYFMDEYFPETEMIDSIIPFERETKIIGVMEDYRYNGIFEEEQATCLFYAPRTGFNQRIMYLDVDPGASSLLEEKVNDKVESIVKASNFLIQDIHTLSERSTKETWIPIIALLSISGFLCINVALGLFGVLWYNISKRKSEIGLRRALGSTRRMIAAQFTGEVMFLTLLAIIVGVFFAVQVPLLKLINLPPNVFYRAMLFSALIILTIVGICALYPSLQASRIQPATALHEDS